VTPGGTEITVDYNGEISGSFLVQVASSSPGIFTLDSSGHGQAAAINQDGSTNSAGRSANEGDIISLYFTGGGQTTPAGSDGKLATLPFPQPVLPVSVTIGGQTVAPLYAGAAPGEIAGLMQINVQIPIDVGSGSGVPVTIQVGTASSQVGVTIAVANK
jgi:uncharacterized protein (TIGR03437 family)